MEDSEAQQDELLALASIYDEKVFSASDEGECPGGQFSASLDLPDAFKIKTGPDKEAASLITVQYLPPITLCFQLPKDYPSAKPPTFTLSCKWLTRQQLSRLCSRLDELWEENQGEVVLFHWTNFLREESVDFLEISSPLDISHIVPKRTSKPLNDQHTSENVEKTSNKANLNCKSSTQSDNTSTDNCSNEDAKFDSRAFQDIASQQLLLPTILEYDKLRIYEEFKTTLYECNVCFMERLGNLCIRFDGCDHVFCKECMKGYFEVQINDGSVKCLTCPNDKCDSQAHPAQVKELVGSELFSRYDRLLLQSSLDTMADIMYCPRKGCQVPVMVERESGMGGCSVCLYNFCIYCKMAYHGVSPCRINPEEIKKIRIEYEGADEAAKKRLEQRYGRRAIKMLIENSMNQEWLEEYSRQCPHCKAHIQKIDGCNKMTCTKCRAYFCWLCSAMLPKADPYSHFNRLGSGCFNRLFAGVVINDEDEEFQEFDELDFADPMFI